MYNNHVDRNSSLDRKGKGTLLCLIYADICRYPLCFSQSAISCFHSPNFSLSSRDYYSTVFWSLLLPILCLYLAPSSALCSKIHFHNFFLSFSISYPSSVMPKHCTTDLQQTQVLHSFSDIFSLSFGPVRPLWFCLCSRELHWASFDSLFVVRRIQILF